MRTSAGIRRTNIFTSFIHSFIKRYGITLLILSTIAIISFFTGIFSVNKYDGGLTEKDFFDKILIILTDGKLTFWKVLFNRVFWGLVFLLVLFLTSHKFLIIINIITLIIFCYFFGIDIGIIFNLCAIRSIIFTIILYIPLMLITITSIIMFNCIFLKNDKQPNKYNFICQKNEALTVLFIVLCISIFMQSLIFPIFNKILIIIE